MKPFISVILFFVTLSVFAAEDEPRTARELFGADNFAIVEQAESVEATLLRYIPPPGKDFGPGERYDEIAYVSVSADASTRMREALLSDSTYVWDIRKGCRPTYGARLRFKRADQMLIIDFCLRCKVLIIARDGRVVNGHNFDRKAHVFIEEMGKLFPNTQIR